MLNELYVRVQFRKDSNEMKKSILVGVIGVNSVAGFSVPIAHTPPSNADVFNAIVIL